jgi:hypothetical protein
VNRVTDRRATALFIAAVATTAAVGGVFGATLARRGPGQRDHRAIPAPGPQRTTPPGGQRWPVVYRITGMRANADDVKSGSATPITATPCDLDTAFTADAFINLLAAAAVVLGTCLSALVSFFPYVAPSLFNIVSSIYGIFCAVFGITFLAVANARIVVKGAKKASSLVISLASKVDSFVNNVRYLVGDIAHLASAVASFAGAAVSTGQSRLAGSRARQSDFWRDVLAGVLRRGPGWSLGSAVGFGLGTGAGWRAMRVAARLMPPAAGGRWLGEAESFLAEAPTELLRRAIRSYLAGAPQVIVISWAALLLRWARLAVRGAAR